MWLQKAKKVLRQKQNKKHNSHLMEVDDDTTKTVLGRLAIEDGDISL